MLAVNVSIPNLTVARTYAVSTMATPYYYNNILNIQNIMDKSDKNIVVFIVIMLLSCTVSKIVPMFIFLNEVI